VYLGSNAGPHTPVFSTEGTNCGYIGVVAAGHYYDILETGLVQAGDSVKVEFSTALPGGTNTPYAFGVRAV
jgi:hypothetical protein